MVLLGANSSQRRFGFFEKMVEFSMETSEATYVNVLSCYANLEMHEYILRNEAVMTVFVRTALIDFYGKKGCLQTSIVVFDQMLIREVCTWNAMIYSFARNVKEMEDLEMFERMKLDGVCPNEVTVVAVLTPSARAKKVELSLELFQPMSSQYGIVPIMEHYRCAVHLLGRAGLLTGATEFIKAMSFQPDTSVWGAQLAACRIHGAFELGNEVERRLLEFQTPHCGHYVALSSINADMERWNRAADLRKAMPQTGIRKVPAFSLVGSI